MRKICFFVGYMDYGGGTQHMTQLLANELSENPDFEVFVLSKSDHNKSTFYKLADKVHYQALDNEPYRGVTSFVKDVMLLRKYIMKNKIDILINVDVGISIFTFPLYMLCPGLKQVYWEHFCVHYTVNNKRMNKLRSLACRFGKAYITLTPEDAQELKELYPKHNLITSIANICPFAISDQEYDLDSKTIISVGNTIPVKGFDMAIEAAEQIVSRHPDWKWEIYGDGSKLEELMAKVREKNLDNNVFFKGRTKELHKIYPKAAIYVMTSRSEGYGMVLAEAQAFHLPTVAFDVPYGPRNIIDPGVNGFLVEPFDIAGMADAIDQLICDRELRKNMSDHAAKNLTKLSAKNISFLWEEMLKEL